MPFAIILFALVALTACRTVPPADTQTAEEKQPEPEPPKIEARAPEVLQTNFPPVAVPQIAVPQVAVPRLPEVVVPTPPAIPRKPVAPEYRWRYVQTDGPYIALTFDDGPNPRNTPALLDVLKQRRIPATFFVLGENANAHPRILQRMVAEGHEIANHGWNHLSLTGMTPEARESQIRKTNQAVERATGRSPTLIRPPYGATTPTLNRWFLEQMQMSVVLWSVDSRDWEYRDPVRIQREIVSTTKPGAIILAHDIHGVTVAAMPATLDALLAKGYKFVTVSELIALGSSR